jgi:DNA-binding CsgD family transcriptional regulator
VLHGRERELEILRARLDGARRGTSFALVLAGEAGIGKTALMRQTIDDAQGFRILRGRGFESEMEIPYAGLLALVRPLLDLAEHLPPQQVAALNSALALGPPTPQDRFAVPVALLALLGAAAEESPLLVAVDDAHWLDPATREALLFAARRLEAEGVGVILTVRDRDGQPAIDVAGLERVDVKGLSESGARSLLVGQVAPSVADVLARATGGNPLALLELPLVLTDEERKGLTPITTPLPTGERVEDLFSAQVAELPDRTRRALGVASALDGGALDQLFGALEQLGLTEEDLAPAESSGVVTVRGSRLLFRHPLIRSAAYHGQTLSERRAAHSALGQTASDGRQRAWHLAQAATGQDQGVAMGLADAADDARRRGGMAEAAVTYARAAELSPFPATAAELQLDGAACAHQAGNVEQALALLDAAEAGALSSSRLNDARRLRGLLTLRIGDIDAGLRILEAESERLAADDPARAAETLLVATPAYMYKGDNDEMFAFAQKARDIVGDSDPRVAELCEVVLTMARSALGTVTEENRHLFDSAVIDPGARSQAAEIMLGSTHGLLFIERYDEVRRRVDAHVDEARGAGAAVRLIYPLALRAELNHRVGRWPAALADITESMRLVEETGYDLLLAGHPVAIDGIIRCDTGDLDEGRRRGEYVAAMGERTGANTILLWAYWLLGRVKLLEGDHAKAADFLLRVPRLRERTKWVEPNIVLADGDIGEALIGAGDLDGARVEAERMQREGEALGRLFPQIAAARTFGLLAEDLDAAEAHFARALELHAQVPLVHEQARTQLLLGSRRRKAGRADEARAPLQAALETFERLGAKPWEARARDELRLAGARQASSVDRAANPAETLTAQEWRVAQLVASGLTNREVAGSLFLSPKTIEHHLSAIYRKLGVRSRTQLARLFGEEVATTAA